LDVSSSNLRARLRERRSVRYLIPDAVNAAIARSGSFDPAGHRQAEEEKEGSA
jgi:hypothetical protein